MMQISLSIWDSMKISIPQIRLPSLHMTAHQLAKLTFDQAEKIKRKVLYVLIINHNFHFFIILYLILIKYKLYILKL
jgi:hypothetical protein